MFLVTSFKLEPAVKKKVLIGIAVVGAILLTAAVGFFLFFLSQFSLYRDPSSGFSMKYPTQWKVLANQGGAAVVFVSPKETALDTFQENVNITIQPVPPHLATLKSFSDKIIQQMTAVFQNMKIIESKNVEFGGRPGHRMLFATEKPQPIKILNVWVIKGDQAYILTYMAMTSRYQTYLSQVQMMIHSFQLK